MEENVSGCFFLNTVYICQIQLHVTKVSQIHIYVTNQSTLKRKSRIWFLSWRG